jgi:lipopolysaccharide/colanic/teichoic acid biosynthesis glycosyltransferase
MILPALLRDSPVMADGQPEESIRFSAWSQSRGKRVFDLACAVPLTLAVLPIMTVVAILVRATSSGPALFRQQRCGKGGQPFELLKFRSMQHSEHRTGPGITRANDGRITRVGRALRKWKLDELPQLLNVLRGNLSMVGPRPDLPEYFAAAQATCRQVLHLRPGITGWATLRYRHEEQLLAKVPADQLKDFYVGVLMPRKARLDLAYGRRATFWVDLAVLLRTCKAIVR